MTAFEGRSGDVAKGLQGLTSCVVVRAEPENAVADPHWLVSVGQSAVTLQFIFCSAESPCQDSRLRQELVWKSQADFACCIQLSARLCREAVGQAA